jgi:hypothetical protein
MSDIYAQELRSTLLSIFRRRGKNGVYCRPIDDMDFSRRSMLLAAVKLNESELPVIGSVLDEKNWMLSTTDRLVWRKDGGSNELELSAIRDVKIDLRKISLYGSKTLNDILDVVSMDGRDYQVRLEAGAALSGVWSVLSV